MNKKSHHDFGIVEEKGDTFEFHYNSGKGAKCRLDLLRKTERGPKRTQVAAIPVALWRKLSVRVVRELASGMQAEERAKKSPKLKFGTNRLGPLLGRELAVLFWALMEDHEERRVEGILSGWRELAREERWWLYTKAIAPGQKLGLGWRRALYLAFSEPCDTRSSQPKERGKLTESVDSKQNSLATNNSQSVVENQPTNSHPVSRGDVDPIEAETPNNLNDATPSEQVNKQNIELQKNDQAPEFIQAELF